jgi:hypothetical protein
MRADDVALPNAALAAFEGSDPGAHVGFTAQLVTSDPDGWPRIALLSAGEIVAVDPARLRIALWPESHTTENATRTGRATLIFVLDNAAYSIRLTMCRGEDLTEPSRLAVFDGRTAEVRRDVADYAVLESGISFRLVDEGAVVDRWRKTTSALLRHHGCDPDGGR